ncbi:MAG: penicillin acylase family protein, partial [Acidobacteria bacterium]|nr:penicillin acylase family protein [Acidobacteriota bacterium]
RWVSVALMEKPREALAQSFGRTKAESLDAFVAVLRGHANSSNNTIFADADGRIAYFHANFVPVRDPRFDYSRPVDGSDPATDWRGVHAFEASPNTIDPPNGWVVNTNDWPYLAAGNVSPRREDYPAYMDRGHDNPRAEHARALLEGASDWTLEGLRAAAFDPWLPAFERLVPPLVADFAALPPADPRRARLAGPVEALRSWDRRWGADSAPTTLASFWADELLRRLRREADEAGVDLSELAARASAREARLAAFEAAVGRIERDFGSWRTPWGEVNRYQRRTGEIEQPFDDAAPSLPVPFVSGRWGSLASFGAGPRNGSRRWYGTNGNSFVAVVELGPTVRALAVTAGGLASDPASPHFADQAERYASGDLREVYLARADVERHAERSYRPGL